jgi:hypothetical protein
MLPERFEFKRLTVYLIALPLFASLFIFVLLD